MKFIVFLLLLACAGARAEAPERWQTEFAAFAAEDAKRLPPPGGVLFVGSSSIRLWDGLEKAFDGNVIKRGFGGSQLEDCVKNLDRLVLRYRPRRIVLYAGENDLAAGRSPEAVVRDFKAFADRVRERLPNARVAFVSVKPSPARKAMVGKARAVNAQVRAYAEADPQDNVEFVDVFTPMLGPDGEPRAELYRSDALHLNDAGYTLWRTLLLPHLR
jgi:lysophospholipase L1-like esterase